MRGTGPTGPRFGRSWGDDFVSRACAAVHLRVRCCNRCFLRPDLVGHTHRLPEEKILDAQKVGGTSLGDMREPATRGVCSEFQ